MKPALSKEFLVPSKENEPMNRPLLAILIAFGTIAFGAIVLSRSPAETWSAGTIGVVTLVVAGAGAAYHPVNRFWWRGFICGGVVRICALVATYYYVRFRVQLTGSVFWLEMFLPMSLGTMPGVGLYILWMKNETVDGVSDRGPT